MPLHLEDLEFQLTRLREARPLSQGKVNQLEVFQLTRLREARPARASGHFRRSQVSTNAPA